MKVGIIIQMFTYAAAIAAMFIAIIGISLWLSDGTKSLASSISTEEIIESEILYEADVTVLAESLYEEEVITESITPDESKEIEDYLVEENTDISIFINEL
jgi:hypothetical protein